MAIKIKYPSRRKRTFYLARVTLRLIDSTEINEWNKIVNEYHPLGAPKLPGWQLRYVAEHCGKALAFLSFSACAYHLSSRDQWIGWSREQRSQRKNFVVQNSRFLVMPNEKHPNLASRVLGLCMKRLPEDWEKQFGFRPLIAETFIDGTKFRGSCYFAAGWQRIGNSKGFKRDAQDFYVGGSVPKGIFVKELSPGAREILCREELPEELRLFETNVPGSLVLGRIGVPRMRSLFSVLQSIKDPRGGQGKKYSLAGCLAIVACGVLAGCTSLRACAELASALSQAQRRTLRFWRNPRSGRYETPDHTTLWRIISKIDAEELERKVNNWLNKENALPGAIAIDGKVLKAAIGNRNSGSCVVSAVAHRAGWEPFFFGTSSPMASARK